MGSDGQYESPSVISAKKLKPHKKIFEDSNAVDCASIPRKLRSVIKKRAYPTISQPLPNPKNCVNGLQTSQTTRRDCVKKPKCGMKQLHPEQMTKDEEEVAETLYALAAGISTRKVTSLGNKSDNESPSERLMNSKKLDDALPSSLGPRSPEVSAEETSNQTSEESSKQKMDVGDMGNSTILSQHKLSQTIIQQNLNQSVAKMSSGTKKNTFEQREGLLSKGVPGNNYVIPQAGDPKHGNASTESKKNGLTLLPSLYSQASRGSGGVDGFPSQYSANKLPLWLHTIASSSAPGFDHQPQVSHKNESQVQNCSRRIKNSCVTHVYICRFIQSSQKAEGKDISLLETRQLRLSDGVTLGVLKTSNHLHPVSNGLTPMVSGNLICSSFPEKNTLDASISTIMMPGKSAHGQEQASLMAPGNPTLRKQCFDFLSLSTGGSGTKTKVEANRNGIQSNPLAGLPVPQLQPMTRYDSVASLPLPPNLIQFNTYQNQRSTSTQPLPPMPQVHLQLPSYFSRSNQLDSSAKQPHPMWMTQPTAAQYRVGNLSQMAQWQSSRQEPYIVQYTQTQTAPSLPSLTLGTSHFPKYLQMPQQHHQNQMLRISAPFPPIQASIQQTPVPIYSDKTES